VITTRPARPEDDDRLREIENATWSADVTPAPRPDPERPFLREDVPAEDVLVAELDARVVGFVQLHQAIPLPSHAHVLEVNGVAVDPDAQRRGVGRALVLAARHEARGRGATKLTLRVLEPNHGARRLYESCGFQVEGVLAGEFVLEGRHVDDLLMACHLG
jgi:ribosomal protein S18 acetylase RimI-like enzyme